MDMFLEREREEGKKLVSLLHYAFENNIGFSIVDSLFHCSDLNMLLGRYNS